MRRLVLAAFAVAAIGGVAPLAQADPPDNTGTETACAVLNGADNGHGDSDHPSPPQNQGTDTAKSRVCPE